MVSNECNHKSGTRPCYDHVVCLDCGAILTDTQWGRASNMWFLTIEDAHYFRNTGTLPDDRSLLPQAASHRVDKTKQLHLYIESVTCHHCKSEQVLYRDPATITLSWYCRECEHANHEEYITQFPMPIAGLSRIDDPTLPIE